MATDFCLQRGAAVLTFFVAGKAEPAGSKRAFPFKRQNGSLGVAVSDANPRSRDWKSLVADAAGTAIRAWVQDNPFELMQGPLELECEFRVPRPKSHFGKRGLLPRAAEFPAGRPDVLKLARGVEDALSLVVWRDDAQIVTELLKKRYCRAGETPGVQVTIREL